MKKKPPQFGASCAYCDMGPLCAPKGLNDEELSALQATIDQHFVLRKGQILQSMGDALRYLYAFKTGGAKAWIITHQGREKVIDFYLKGEVIGLDALGQRQYPSTVVGLEDSVVCRLQYHQLCQVMDRYPRVRDHLLTLASNKLNQRTKIFQHQEAEQRLVAFLSDHRERLHNRLCQDIVQFTLPMSRVDIANYLDLTPETISRLFTRLKNNGLVRLQGKNLEFINPPGNNERCMGI